MAVNIALGALLAVVIAWPGGRATVTQTPPSRPALSGAWSLNVEESSASSDVASTAPTPPPPDAPPQPVGPGAPTDGAGRLTPWIDPGKTGSLLPPNVTNAMNPTQPPKDKGRALADHERLLLELTTPPSRVVIVATPEAVAVTREGRTDTFVTNGKTEKHRVVNGSIKTKTYWTDSALRQEIDGGDALKLLRTFQVDDRGRLVVITRPADDKSVEFQTMLVSRLGTGDATKGRKRAVYDAESK